jgi:hypothetical protein
VAEAIKTLTAVRVLRAQALGDLRIVSANGTPAYRRQRQRDQLRKRALVMYVSKTLTAVRVLCRRRRDAGADIDQHISGWWNADDAVERADPKATATTCSTCPEYPCAEYACGVPESKYRGGAHGYTKLPVGDELDSHHIGLDQNRL